MNIYKTAIIGAGSIGANKPDHIDSPATENILTHAHAVTHHQRTELTAIIDPNEENLNKAARKWQPKHAFHSIEDLEFHPDKMDIIILACPTNSHCFFIQEISNWSEKNKPSLIICEKPFCDNLRDAENALDHAKYANIPILINYNRRFTKGHQEIKEKFDAGEYGKALNCRVLYTRGMQRDGCHWIDLMKWFFGDFYCKEISPAPYIHDLSSEDPSFSGYMDFEKCNNVVFQACDGRLYGIFEIDICFEKCRIRLIENGMYYEKYPIIQEGAWGHKELLYKLTDVVRKETGLPFSLYQLIDNAVNFLDRKEPLKCTAEDAIAVHRIIEG